MCIRVCIWCKAKSKIYNKYRTKKTARLSKLVKFVATEKLKALIFYNKKNQVQYNVNQAAKTFEICQMNTSIVL